MNPVRRSLTFGLPAVLCWPGIARSAAPDPIAAYEKASGGRIGVHAINARTGASISWRAHERFIMCSSFKASLAAFVLSRVDRGEEDLNATVHYTAADIHDVWAPAATAYLSKGAMSIEAMCRAAVELSDGACANLLLARMGGPAALTAFWRSIGDKVSRLDHYEPVLDRSPSGGPADSTTPAAIGATLQKLVLGTVLSAPSRTRLTDWLIGCQTGADRLRAGLPGNWRIGDKTGHNGRDVAVDLAVAWPRPDTPIVITVFTRDGRPTDRQFDTVFAAVANLVASTLA